LAVLDRECLFAGVSPEMDALFTHLQHKRELEVWVEVVRAAEEMTVAPLITDAIGRASDARFPALFEELLARFGDPRLSRRIYFSLLDARSERLVPKGLSVVLNLLDMEFKRVVNEFPAALAFPDLAASLAPAAHRILFEAVRGLNCLDASNLGGRMAILLQTMGLLSFVQKVGEKHDTMLPVVFKHNKGQELLSTFLVLHTFAMNQETFNALCSDRDRYNWVRLESVILGVLAADPPIFEAYVTMRERLMETAITELY
jgi:hypothetical protein